MKDKIFVNILTRGKLDFELVSWLVKEIFSSSDPSCPFEIGAVNISAGTPLVTNANHAIKEFLKTDCTHILMLDDDITPSSGTILSLFDNQKDIVSARVLISQPEFDAPISIAGIYQGEGKPYKLVDTLAPELITGKQPIQVDFIGLGCALIKRRVFEKIKAPWFVQQYSKDGSELLKGTDTIFCEKAEAKGFEIYCDMRLLTGQKTTMNLAEYATRMMRVVKRNIEARS